MKGAVWLALAPAALALGCAASRPAYAPRPTPVPVADLAGRPEHLVLISVAGLTPDRYLAGETMPALRAFAAAGVAAEAVEVVAPAAAYPAHASLLTGVAPAAHGVVADRLLGPHGVRRVPPRHASQLRAPTLWQRVAESGGSVAAFDWPTTTGAQIASLLPDVEPERAGEEWAGLAAAASTGWVKARVEGAPAAAAEPGAARDALLVDLACAAFAESPRFVLLRLRGAEAALARGGPRALEAAAAFTEVDGEIERLVRCVERAGRLAETAFAVAGDRALLATHTVLRPNVWLRDAGFLPAQGRWQAIARSNGGSAFVYASEAGTAVRARQRLEAEARESGAFRVVSAEEMIARGTDPGAWFGLEAEPGYAFEDGAQGEALAPSAFHAAGGQLALAPERATGFVAFGRGVRRGLGVPRMTQLDVAPTLAALLGVPLEPAVGRVLVGLLRVGPDAAAGPQPETPAGDAPGGR
jgi:hypothetical protein